MVSQQILAASDAARQQASEAGRGPIGLLWNTLASQLALLAAAAQGVESGAQAPGVGAGNTGG